MADPEQQAGQGTAENEQKPDIDAGEPVHLNLKVKAQVMSLWFG
jgi:hypothetical protein